MSELNRLSTEEFRKAPKRPVILVLDEVRSLLNVGSVFRTADAFRIEGLWLCGLTPQPPGREINKTALGATESVAWRHFHRTEDAIHELRAQGYRIFGVEQTTGSAPLQVIPPAPEKRAIIFGHEVKGIASEVLALCDEIIEIPQFGTKHSFNIAVSAGIVLWQLCPPQ